MFHGLWGHTLSHTPKTGSIQVLKTQSQLLCSAVKLPAQSCRPAPANWTQTEVTVRLKRWRSRGRMFEGVYMYIQAACTMCCWGSSLPLWACLERAFYAVGWMWLHSPSIALTSTAVLQTPSSKRTLLLYNDSEHLGHWNWSHLILKLGLGSQDWQWNVDLNIIAIYWIFLWSHCIEDL